MLTRSVVKVVTSSAGGCDLSHASDLKSALWWMTLPDAQHYGLNTSTGLPGVNCTAVS